MRVGGDLQQTRGIGRPEARILGLVYLIGECICSSFDLLTRLESRFLLTPMYGEGMHGPREPSITAQGVFMISSAWNDPGMGIGFNFIDTPERGVFGTIDCPV